MRCHFCGRKMNVSSQGYLENPFCTKCLPTRMRMAALQDPVIHRRVSNDGKYLLFIRKSDLHKFP